VPLAETDAVAQSPADDLLALDEALARLAAAHPVKAELVKLRYFAGLSEEEAASALAGIIHRRPHDGHHEYAKARQEFKTALAEVVSFHHPGAPEEVERDCANLLSFLG
jgi:hypothetical protein